MHQLRRRTALLVLMALFASACSNPAENEDLVRVQLIVQGERATAVTLHTRLGRRQVTLSAASGNESSEIAFPGTGTFPVSVVLLDASGDTLAATTIDHQFERGFNHHINATVGQRATYWVACGGPIVRVPLRGAASADTLFVERLNIPQGALC